MSALEIVPEHPVAPEFKDEIPTEVQLAQAVRRGGHLALVSQVEVAPASSPIASHQIERAVVREIPRHMEVSGISAW